MTSSRYWGPAYLIVSPVPGDPLYDSSFLNGLTPLQLDTVYRPFSSSLVSGFLIRRPLVLLHQTARIPWILGNHLFVGHFIRKDSSFGSAYPFAWLCYHENSQTRKETSDRKTNHASTSSTLDYGESWLFWRWIEQKNSPWREPQLWYIAKSTILKSKIV